MQEQPAQKFEQQTGSIESTNTEVAPAPATTSEIQIKADYPRQYIVVKGDTLWDIATKFLQDPWYWPEIWYRNPQVKNPHLIYPGDILTLIYVNGMPQIQLSRGEDTIRTEQMTQGKKVIKLSPNIHRQSLNEAIPTIPSDAIRQFLTRPRVISDEEWEAAPYIVGSDDAHLIMGASNKIYVRGELDKERIRYSVFRKGNELIDPDTNDTLGYEIIYAGQARISSYGTPSTGELVSTQREVLIGDRLLPSDKSAIDQMYYPRLPDKDINAKVISLLDAISSIAKHQIAVINKGKDDGLEIGHLLGTYQKGMLARDRSLSLKNVKRGEEDKLMVQLPDERSGLMMIFKTFDKVSYGLILESTRVIKKFDAVRKPH
ncbi:MAG: LysM peptidoglycan-binding domain-containing protein [Gammaproteobacteria bacterium]|nr:LysM peptidoglycan-binding domain-containing protein [Gammaproteobacteria bacterium]